MTALERTRLEREWRGTWRALGIDWRTAYEAIPRRIGQRRRDLDGYVRVADACEVGAFSRG